MVLDPAKIDGVEFPPVAKSQKEAAWWKLKECGPEYLFSMVCQGQLYPGHDWELQVSAQHQVG